MHQSKDNVAGVQGSGIVTVPTIEADLFPCLLFLGSMSSVLQLRKGIADQDGEKCPQRNFQFRCAGPTPILLSNVTR